MSPRTPLEGASLLLIDGNNLLHRLAGRADESQLRLLLARLRGALPPTLTTVLVLDGHAAPGAPSHQRLGGGFELRHAGRQSADDAIVSLLEARPAHLRGGVLIVSEDRTLMERVRSAGGRTERLEWLEARLEQPARATGIGAAPGGAAPRGATPGEADPGDDERPAWQPGRGATKKRGNPRRQPRHR